MGVSILSIIEIIYFATLRLVCTLKLPENQIKDEELAIGNTEIPVFEKRCQLELQDCDKF